MTSREFRKQRREDERRARKLAYQQSRAAALESSFSPGERSSSALAPGERSSSAFTPNPDLFDEFSAEEQIEMMAIRARVHARAGITDLPKAPAVPESKPGSTGPRSPEGKATSSGNSLKHGLASGRVIIPGEDPAEFEGLLSDLIQEHAPANETESLLAQSWWLMQRAIRMQNDAFTETRVDTHKLSLFLRYQTTHERAFYRALNTLLKLSRARGVRSTSASAPQQAVSSRRKSAPEFVSQAQPQTSPENGFVSQNRPHTLPEPVRFAK